MSKHLPTDALERKKIPLWTGLLKYFPDALVAVASVSQTGNDQHNPGQPLHWAREKSKDQEDTLLRHLLESGTLDTDGHRHSAKVAWRALALLQLEIEKDQHDQDNKKSIQYKFETPPIYQEHLTFCGVRLLAPNEKPVDVAYASEASVNEINQLLSTGWHCSRWEFSEETDENLIVLASDPTNKNRSFLVRGKVQRSSNSLGSNIQPGRVNSGFSDPAFWDITQNNESSNEPDGTGYSK